MQEPVGTVRPGLCVRGYHTRNLQHGRRSRDRPVDEVVRQRVQHCQRDQCRNTENDNSRLDELFRFPLGQAQSGEIPAYEHE